ncbi:MAG: hypothetical protein ACFE9O_08995 [Promethearchaeota archaeon]
MAGLEKIDIACIAFMTFVILTVSGYMAVFRGWAEINGSIIWVGWIWWVVFGVVIASLLVIIISSRRRPR